MTENNEESKDRQFVTALARGLEVLRCFSSVSPELSASEIARMTGIPQPTVWRLCYTLLQLGYLVAMPGRQTMRPGIPLLGLGQSVLASQPIGELAYPRMLSIAQKHEGAVSLGARYSSSDDTSSIELMSDLSLSLHLSIASRFSPAQSWR